MERYAKNGCASLALIPYLHDGSWQGDDKKRALYDGHRRAHKDNATANTNYGRKK